MGSRFAAVDCARLSVPLHTPFVTALREGHRSVRCLQEWYQVKPGDKLEPGDTRRRRPAARGRK